jgi:hypothetical protein
MRQIRKKNGAAFKLGMPRGHSETGIKSVRHFGPPESRIR